MALETADDGAEDLLPDGHLLGAKIPGALRVQTETKIGALAKAVLKIKPSVKSMPLQRWRQPTAEGFPAALIVEH